MTVCLLTARRSPSSPHPEIISPAETPRPFDASETARRRPVALAAAALSSVLGRASRTRRRAVGRAQTQSLRSLRAFVTPGPSRGRAHPKTIDTDVDVRGGTGAADDGWLAGWRHRPPSSLPGGDGVVLVSRGKGPVPQLHESATNQPTKPSAGRPHPTRLIADASNQTGTTRLVPFPLLYGRL
jgi:hypothetical protein